ncbi:MAG: NAD(P)-dependent oxidoreductase [Actinomycetia bacterium]|nr:NAD(P)-dependent oxidoreductase [Actinomycetes bacterium]
MSERVLVTGHLGCIGAWVAKLLLADGDHVVGFDLGTHDHRLRLIMDGDELGAIEQIRGDITDTHAVQDAAAGVDRIIHLAALQVPFCAADPVAGARVNVVGTVNVFEAARHQGIGRVTWASSVAVHGTADRYDTEILPADAERAPGTFYGVYKQANEGTARVYETDHGIASVGLLPHTIYGPGRDQGLTSQPTTATLAAALGRPYRVDYASKMGFQYAPDVARSFIAASRVSNPGSLICPLGGDIVMVQTFLDAVNEAVGEELASCTDNLLPFPAGTDDGPLRTLLDGQVPHTPLREAIEETVAVFRKAAAAGQTLPDLPT